VGKYGTKLEFGIPLPTEIMVKMVTFMFQKYCLFIRQYPGNVPPPSKPEDSIFCKTVNSYGMKVNITI